MTVQMYRHLSVPIPARPAIEELQVVEAERYGAEPPENGSGPIAKRATTLVGKSQFAPDEEQSR